MTNLAFSKVNTFLIGAQKCGTTTLAKALREHPDVSLPLVKETNFFSIGKYSIHSYHKNFDFSKIIRVDASTSYSMKHRYNGVAKKIYDYNKRAKILYLVRNPIDRIESHFNFQLAKGYNQSLDDILLDKHFVSNSLYYYQIKDYIKYFGKDLIFVIDFHELVDNNSKTLSAILNFLEIPDKIIAVTHENESIGIPRVPSRLFNKITSNRWISFILGLSPRFRGALRIIIKFFSAVELKQKVILPLEIKLELEKITSDDLKKMEKEFAIKLDRHSKNG